MGKALAGGGRSWLTKDKYVIEHLKVKREEKTFPLSSFQRLKDESMKPLLKCFLQFNTNYKTCLAFMYVWLPLS